MLDKSFAEIENSDSIINTSYNVKSPMLVIEFNFVFNESKDQLRSLYSGLSLSNNVIFVLVCDVKVQVFS